MYYANKVDNINNTIEFKNPQNFLFLKDVNLRFKRFDFFIFRKEKFHNYYCLDYKFIIFNSIDDILYLIYSGGYNKNIIVLYDLIDDKIKVEIKYGINKEIFNYRHYLDNNNKIDYVLAMSSDNSLVVLNINNCVIITKINFDIYYEEVCTACFLNYNNNIHIITSSGNWGPYDKIFQESTRGFNLNGNQFYQYHSNNVTYCIDSFYDNIQYKYFLIVGCEGFIKSYEYENMEKKERIYDFKKTYNYLYKSIIYNKDKKVKLIEPGTNGEIRIWDFYSPKILHRIKISKEYGIGGICLWNNNNLLVACRNKTIKLVILDDNKDNKILDCLDGYNRAVSVIKKVIHPQYGEILISKETRDKNKLLDYDGQIKLWINKTFI